MFRLIIICCLLLLVPFTPAFAEDWPQWQGPDRNAVSKERGLLQQWPKAGPPLAWRVDGLGGGDSAPAIVGGRLFGMSNRNGKEIAWARSEKTGKEIWASPLGDAAEQRVHQSKEGPGGTPSVDGNSVYVIGMSGRVACLRADDGKVVWQRSLIEDFGGASPMWSFRESPLVDGDKVICTPGASDAMLVALDKATGKTIWKTRMPGEAETPATGRSGPGENRSRSTQPQRSQNSGAPKITGTRNPELFLSEHWGMTGFAHKVPSGKYLVKLYFAETFSGITREGQRVFSLAVEGKEFKDFDIWKKAGGPRKAYIESVAVDVTDGELSVSFTQQSQSPAIKAIEIIPQNKGAKPTDTIRVKAGESRPFKDSNGNVWLADRGFTGGSTSPGFFNFGGGGRRSGRGFGGRGGARSGAAYASVIAIDFEGQRQYVQLTAKSLMGISANDGKVLWQYEKPANGMGINCSTPIFHNGVLFAASAYGSGGGAVRLSKADDGTVTAKEIYFTPRMQNHHGGMIVIDGCLYGANGGNGGGMLACLDFKTGDTLWRSRKGPKGALLLADRRLYLRGEEGEIVLIEPSRDEFIERGRFEQPNRSSVPAWAHPVIANGKLYIRDQGLLLCYDVTAK